MKKKCLIYLFLLILVLSSNVSSYDKIIPMAPNLVETVYALGKGDKVAAVPMFTVYPKDALDKVNAGSYLNPSFESILKVSPDLIIIQGNFKKITDFTKMYKIKTLNVNMDSIDSIYSGILKIGGTLNCKDKAVSLVNSIRSEINTNDIKIRPKVFICIGRNPGTLKQIYTCGNMSFISELVELTGGTNIFSDIDKNYLMVSKEEILKRSPDIILDILPGTDLNKSMDIKIKKLWMRLFNASIKKEKIHILNQNFILIPGPRIVDTSKLFKAIFLRD